MINLLFLIADFNYKSKNLIDNDEYNNQPTCNISKECVFNCISIINGSEDLIYDYTIDNIDCKNSIKTNFSKTRSAQNCLLL